MSSFKNTVPLKFIVSSVFALALSQANASASSFTEENPAEITSSQRQYQNAPMDLEHEKMYKASYTLALGLSEIDVPEDLGKKTEMLGLINRWKDEKTDTLGYLIQELIIVEITDEELQSR